MGGVWAPRITLPPSCKWVAMRVRKREEREKTQGDGIQEGHRRQRFSPHPPRAMDYPEYAHKPAQHPQPPQPVWPPHLLTHPGPPSPVSPPGPYLFPAQTSSQPPASPATDPHPTASGLSLNLTGLSVASPPTLSPTGSHQAQPGQLHPHQLHALHHHHPTTSPITPTSPQNMPLAQLQFSYNFDDPIPSAGLSPAPDPVLTQRRPASGSVSSELVVEKSVPRKRSLTSTLPVSPSVAHTMHHHSQSHSYSSTQTGQAGQHLPHPIITTTASSPPLPTSSTSSPSSHPSHSHSRSLSHSLSHSSLSHSPQRQRPHPRLEINSNPASPYDEIDSAGPGFSGIGDDGSDDDFGSASGSFSAGGPLGDYGFHCPSHVLTHSSRQRQLKSIWVIGPTRAKCHRKVCWHQQLCNKTVSVSYAPHATYA